MQGVEQTHPIPGFQEGYPGPAIEKLQESPRHSMSEAQERSPNLYLKNGRKPSPLSC